VIVSTFVLLLKAAKYFLETSQCTFYNTKRGSAEKSGLRDVKTADFIQYWQWSGFKNSGKPKSFIKQYFFMPNMVEKQNSKTLAQPLSTDSKLELDWCIGKPIYISWYDDVADVSYRQNSADIYWKYLFTKVLRCCSAWSVRKPKLLLRLWPWLINAKALSCS